MFEIEFLGTGTSTGVPQIGCDCEVCKSADKRDNRLRTSAIVRTKGKNILIDCGPDFRTQILRSGSPDIDCLLLTHIHYDHVGGIDDLRPYTKNNALPVYARADVINDLKARLPYCFQAHPYPGVPKFKFEVVEDNHDFSFCGIDITPISVMHYKLPILGYRIGTMAYITDAKYIAPEQIEKLHGLEVLVINSLQFEQHLSHMTLEESLEVINQVKPKVAYLTHMGHHMGLHAQTEKILPPNVKLAYDGLVVRV